MQVSCPWHQTEGLFELLCSVVKQSRLSLLSLLLQLFFHLSHSLAAVSPVFSLFFFRLPLSAGCIMLVTLACCCVLESCAALLSLHVASFYFTAAVAVSLFFFIQNLFSLQLLHLRCRSRHTLIHSSTTLPKQRQAALRRQW
jgi:hypothetical protein